MAIVLADNVRETTSTTGTGTWTLAGAVTGSQSFSAGIGVGNQTHYSAQDGAGNREVGIGTVGSGTLSRDKILSSSNSGAAVNFPTAPTVWCDASAALITAAKRAARIAQASTAGSMM